MVVPGATTDFFAEKCRKTRVEVIAIFCGYDIIKCKIVILYPKSGKPIRGAVFWRFWEGRFSTKISAESVRVRRTFLSFSIRKEREDVL